MKATPFGLLLIIAALTDGQVITYEGRVLPEQVGWERAGTLDADRWNDDGWLCHFLELGVWEPPPLGEMDFYWRSLAHFAGGETFFIQWRVETDAPGSILDFSGIPVAVSAGGTSAAVYHTTVTDTRVQLFRDTFIPLVFVDIEPGVAHTYRLELYGDEWYAWYIDGQVVDSGVPEGAYPADSSVLVWGARHHTFDNTTRWDYVRCGTIPEDGTGDYDSDGRIDAFDFYFVADCFLGPDEDSTRGCRFADLDQDDDADLHDFALFQNAFTGGVE